MFKKPQGYDGAEAPQNVVLPSGVYPIGILKAKEEMSKKGKRMLVLYVDIIDGKYKDHFKTKYQKDTRDNKKWGCIFYQLVDGNSLPFFKGLITAIETSNGIKWDWELASLKGCVMAGVFQRQEVELKDNNKRVWTTKLISIRSTQAMEKNEIIIPEDKPLDDYIKDDYIVDGGANDIDNDDVPF